MFGCQSLGRAKSSIFSTITLAALIFIIYAFTIISNISLQSLTFDAKEISYVRIKSIASRLQLCFMQEEIDQVPKTHQSWSLIPPLDVKKEERIVFLKKPPEFKILYSSNLTKRFHGRVLEFFDLKCEVQFFMTWISPANSFGRRELSCMESLFDVHRRGCLMIISRTMDSVQGYRILKPILDRGYKVRAVAPDLSFLFKSTPAEAWFREIKSGHKDPGEIPLAQNLSNLISLAILYKYGGIYLDTDFFVLKSFKGLRNSIGAQSIDSVSKKWTRLNNAVMVFDMNHPLLFEFMQEFASTFDGNKWGHNGPYLVSRVVENVEGRPGYNFTILPPMAFYPVYWTRIERLFKKPKNWDDSSWVKGQLLQLSGETYGVHLWNKLSSRFKIEEGSILGSLISHHCVICDRIIALDEKKLTKKW
ncbi:Gly_transf_sug domain-containing protein/Gb3_synth domain-containing protein [Cephalotus follicularis]|uniref:Gly_transf_sug domain-containing protein/Gb3_synth domain-containing protein n=1 Tax=Cephalotus follicularis TaxID=3775 RepID=A0A1Q3C5E9_CEPFO|nr:Gly_transf_sug domain-containing protein/Gb3_synth domain-containing protein [Cephalotus follicularis]